MQLVEDLNQIKKPYPGAVVTIGNFDGVHKGHQALFRALREKAEQIRGTSVVITFDPHPLRVLSRKKMPALITLKEQKTELIAANGIDVCICIPFTRTFAGITAGEFVEDILINRIGMKAMVVGEDYAFGRNREGDIDFLKKAAGKSGFELICLEKVALASYSPKISSTVIRNLVNEGDMEAAREMLGRYYQIRGEVVSGRGRGGRSLGFPTANLELADELCPLSGVYAVMVTHQSKKYRGVANIGYSPTFEDHIFTVEVHLLDFNQVIKGDQLRVDFIYRIRDEKKFSGIDELKAQIQKDIELAGQLLTEKGF